MRVQLTNPAEHAAVMALPLADPLATWEHPDLHGVGGLHRHVVRRYEHGEVTYVVKELPDRLVEREYRLLRHLAEAELPTVEVVGSVTERAGTHGEGLLITRFLDYSLPYRTLLSGRGLHIPYLGDRLLDALAGLLVRLHLIGFYWGDCSLSNTLFRRDAGALVAYIIDVETAEVHPPLTEGQRSLDLQIGMENVAGDLTDLQLAGRLAEDIDPLETALAIERTYQHLWDELTRPEEFLRTETYRVDQRLCRLAELGFSVAEVELENVGDGKIIRAIPRVVEHGHHARRLSALTGLQTGENQARRLLHDIARYGAVLEERDGLRLPESLVAARWLDAVFMPAIAAIPTELTAKLEPAELYHHLLEHRWYMSEQAGEDVGMDDAVESYVATVLVEAPDERAVEDVVDVVDEVEPLSP